jgi:hypothetical protein
MPTGHEDRVLLEPRKKQKTALCAPKPGLATARYMCISLTGKHRNLA